MTKLCWPNGRLDAEPRRTDNYGPRDPIWTSGGWTRPYHVGTDWAGIGRICSIGNGVVISTEYIGWAGWQVLIDLGVIDGERTWVRDCHLAEQSPLRVGDRVSMGQFIGTEGATGQVTGRHLHKEIYRGRVDRGSGSNPGSTVDPAKFIAAHVAAPTGGITLPALIRTPDGSIGFVSDAGMLDAISSLNEVESLKASGVVGNWVQLPDMNIWNTLAARTARLRAQQTPVDSSKLSSEVAALMVGPVVEAVSRVGGLSKQDVEAAVKSATKDLLSKVVGQ